MSIKTCLESLPWINAAYVAKAPSKIACLELNPQGIEVYRQQGRAHLLALINQHLPEALISELTLFTDKLPNQFDVIDLEQKLTQGIKDPEWHSCQEKDNTYVLQGQVPVDLLYFRDHFDSFPLVPGVVILRWIKKQAQKIYPALDYVGQVKNLKFQNFTQPNDLIELTFIWDKDKQRLEFKLETAGKPSCKGYYFYA
ncbi:ApeI family dehydratase [Psittacicella hinzii]|uniref:ApeI dehydratase-like domain-containing protein n=1 Tax=Psittacicella hinzii TaxID=2028575 RepID=A0A3A1YUG9_9GAMM|nr:hypothetical protein [Psittacicella hinzii]RIY39717.1 hypothetical protein CKF58_01855 [Psittacicella hinzii]